MSSADFTIYIPDIGTLSYTVSLPPGDNSAHFLQLIAAIHNFSNFRSTRYSSLLSEQSRYGMRGFAQHLYTTHELSCQVDQPLYVDHSLYINHPLHAHVDHPLYVDHHLCIRPYTSWPSSLNSCPRDMDELLWTSKSYEHEPEYISSVYYISWTLSTM